MISVKAKVLSAGPMEDNTLVSGKQENNMALERTLASKTRRSKVFGKMEKK